MTTSKFSTQRTAAQEEHLQEGGFAGAKPIPDTSLAHTVLEMGKGHPKLKPDGHLA